MNTVVSAASLASAAAIASPSIADEHSRDPIFAAIEQHRSAALVWMRAVDVECELEGVIPSDRRQNYHIDDRDDPTIGRDDDPRWTAARIEYWATADAAAAAAVALCDTAPTSVAGIEALLDYIDGFALGKVAISKSNCSSLDHLPGDLIDGDCIGRLGTPVEMPFAFWVLRNVREALRRINGATSPTLIPLIRAAG